MNQITKWLVLKAILTLAFVAIFIVSCVVKSWFVGAVLIIGASFMVCIILELEPGPPEPESKVMANKRRLDEATSSHR